MSDLYTKNGRPLAVRGDRVYNKSGQHFGYIKGDKVFGIRGDYRGTIVGGRLVYRSTHAAHRVGVRSRYAAIGGIGRANRAGAATLGQEPNTEP
jgi:hypothetical protein